MLQTKPSLTPEVIRLHTHEGDELIAHLPRLQAYLRKDRPTPLSRDPAWLSVLRRGLGCTPYCLEAVQDDQTCGVLPLAYVKTMLFGRFLVSLPYLNSGGVVANNAAIAGRLIDRAVELADQLQVRYLELRHERAAEHPALGHRLTSKVHMRRALPNFSEALLADFPAKLRSQIRKGEKNGLAGDSGG